MIANEMRSRLRLALAIGAALAMTGAPVASANSAPTEVAVHVQRRLSISDNVRVSFHPSAALPAGGYYYAVIVLKPYKHYTRTVPPPCAVSSDMQKTAYAYAHAGQEVGLALTRTASRQHRWCSGGSYIGAIYAVPNPPPCDSRYPCSSEYSEASPCWEIQPGHKVCGVVARPRVYAYPANLPAPLEKGTRIIGYFRVSF
jgi:hypothetical protein